MPDAHSHDTRRRAGREDAPTLARESFLVRTLGTPVRDSFLAPTEAAIPSRNHARLKVRMAHRATNRGASVDARPGRATVGLLVFVVLLALMGWGAVTAGRPTPDVALPDRLDVHHPHIVILKSKRKLYLFDDQKLVRTYDVALGSHPTGQKRRQSDGRTPEGRFHIRTKNDGSKYCRFLGIDYPDRPAALRGLHEGLISHGEYEEILCAHVEGRCPIWTTALGGGIGLHGHGISGDWTAGCVALSDADIIELYGVLRLGDTVEILP
jgi:lipoprotein-anchoring transpeptidase ErfK/SrfK